jgi:hypothetical protein
VADEELVRRLREGTESWNAWRRQRTEAGDPMFSTLDKADPALTTFDTAKRRPDLSGADLTGAELDKVNLSGVNLAGARFDEASLDRADLHGADLRGAVFTRAKLSFADLVGTNLSDAVFADTSLSNTYLQHAYLTCADLSRTLLLATNLEDADLSEAKLRESMLSQIPMRGAKLVRTDLSNAAMHDVVFADVNLSSCIGLETCEHLGPSVVDFRTLKLSHPLPLAFLRGIGLPDALYRTADQIDPAQMYRLHRLAMVKLRRVLKSYACNCNGIRTHRSRASRIHYFRLGTNTRDH